MTWQQAAELDLPSVAALEEQWRRCPPVQYLVAAYLDYQAPNDPSDPAAKQQVETELASALPVRTDVAPTSTEAFDAAIAALPNPESSRS